MLDIIVTNSIYYKNTIIILIKDKILKIEDIIK